MCEALPFKPYRQKDIEWRTLSDDDFIAEKKLIGITYTLRVEQIDKYSWWACFYINGSQEWVNDEWLKTEKQAKRAVLRALNKHCAKA